MSYSPYPEQQPPQPQPHWQQTPGHYGQPNNVPTPYVPYTYPMPTAPPKSPGVAVILSILVPGLGHLYSGNPLSAVFWFVSAIVAAALIYILIGFVLLPMVWIGSIIHAYVSTTNYNTRHHVVR